MPWSLIERVWAGLLCHIMLLRQESRRKQRGPAPAKLRSLARASERTTGPARCPQSVDLPELVSGRFAATRRALKSQESSARRVARGRRHPGLCSSSPGAQAAGQRPQTLATGVDHTAARCVGCRHRGWACSAPSCAPAMGARYLPASCACTPPVPRIAHQQAGAGCAGRPGTIRTPFPAIAGQQHRCYPPAGPSPPSGPPC